MDDFRQYCHTQGLRLTRQFRDVGRDKLGLSSKVIALRMKLEPGHDVFRGHRFGKSHKSGQFGLSDSRAVNRKSRSYDGSASIEWTLLSEICFLRGSRVLCYPVGG
jgi:hypothetical protein